MSRLTTLIIVTISIILLLSTIGNNNSALCCFFDNSHDKLDSSSHSFNLNARGYNIFNLNEAYAAKFTLKINQRVFVPNDSLIIYGSGLPGDSLLVALIDPSGKTIRIDSVTVDENGSFFKEYFIWPQPTKNFVFGQYTLSVSSSASTNDNEQISITFAEGISQSLNVAETHILLVKLDSPASVTTNSTFRIFVQVTYDGALVDSDLPEFLGSSHIHSGGQTINLSNRFDKLHEGIYYADVVLPTDGTYIIHAIAYHKGFESHDSKVVTASSTSIGTIQESVTKLRNELDKTTNQLNTTKLELVKVVDDARLSIQDDIQRTQEASGQLNSIILPVLVLISVIIALQISLFARIRASYR